jgi:hypothetical protein
MKSILVVLLPPIGRSCTQLSQPLLYVVAPAQTVVFRVQVSKAKVNQG